MNDKDADTLRRWVEEEREKYLQATLKRARYTLRERGNMPLDEVPTHNVLRELRLNYEEALHALRVAEGRDG